MMAGGCWANESWRRFRAEVGAHQRAQFALHHADQGLAGRERGNDFFAQGFFLDLAMNSRTAGRATSASSRARRTSRSISAVFGFGQPRFAAHGLDDFGKPLGEVI